jgi:hypothetical protein
MSSICPGADWKDKYDEIQWNRANKIPYVTNDETKLVLFGNDMKDIQIGPVFKDQALINAMSNLNGMIKKVFVNEINDQDVYCLEFLQGGEKKRINVNSAMPTL